MQLFLGRTKYKSYLKFLNIMQAVKRSKFV